MRDFMLNRLDLEVRHSELKSLIENMNFVSDVEPTIPICTVEFVVYENSRHAFAKGRIAFTLKPGQEPFV
jgi:hypothetical protein